MTLHSSVDTVAFVTNGFYSMTYGAGEEANLANLFAFYGLIEDAPEGGPAIAAYHIPTMPTMPVMPGRRI